MITTGGIMCIIRRCSINGSGTSANMNTPREQYAASSSINRLLHAPFYFLHSVLNGFSSLHISPSAFSLYFFPPFFIDHRRAPFAFFRHLQKCRIDRGQNRNSRVWAAFPFDFFESRRLFRFYFHDAKFVFFLMARMKLL